MNKKDIIDNLLIKAYKMIKDEIMPAKKRCPGEDMLWKYIKRELNEKKKGVIEEHLLACSGCMETLETIGMIIKAGDLPGKVPERLHNKAEEILENELRRTESQIRIKGITQKITLLWDKLQNKITPLTPVLKEMNIPDRLEFQAVREPLDASACTGACLFRTAIDTERGMALFEIERSGDEKALILKIVFSSDKKGCLANLRVNLYKSGRICSSVSLNKKGEAFFHRIREGSYNLEFLEEAMILKIIRLSIFDYKDETHMPVNRHKGG